MIRVAMDATSGERAVIEAAAHASRHLEVEVLLVSPVDEASEALEQLRYAPARLQLVAAAPGRVAALLASGEAEALVAAEVDALLEVAHALEGSMPPVVAAVRPGEAGPSLLLDAGASEQVTAPELAAWALAGVACATALGFASLPRVAWVQGTDPPAVEEARRHLADAGLRFVEDLPIDALTADRVDVAVCDGNTGRRALDHIEQAGQRPRSWLRRAPRPWQGLRLVLGAPAVLVAPRTPDDLDDAVRFAARAVARNIPDAVTEAVVWPLEDPR